MVINNYSFDCSDGFMIAVRFHHATNATLSMSVATEHVVMLSAAAAEPAPPMYDLPQPDPTETGGSDGGLASDA